MRDRNIAFMETYKKADKFIRDAYGTKDGITEYITQMEQEMENSRARYNTMYGDYKMLKHLRWVRNQYAHEVSIDDKICTEEDYDWICSFYDQLLHANDPLSQLHYMELHGNEQDGKPPRKGAMSKWVLLLLLLCGVVAGLMKYWL